jgi:hypothetical protein
MFFLSNFNFPPGCLADEDAIDFGHLGLRSIYLLRATFSLARGVGAHSRAAECLKDVAREVTLAEATP